MNRYSRVTPSQFNPLSLSEIMAPALAKQQIHDTSMQRLDELGLFDIERLKQDENFTSDYINNYTDEVNAQADAIMAGGVNSQSMRDVMKLKRKRDSFLKNEGRDIIKNYQGFQENKKVLDAKLARNEITGNRYDEILEVAEREYKGHKNGPYESYMGAKDVNIGEKITKYAKDLDRNKVAANYGLIESEVDGVLTYASGSFESRNNLDFNEGKGITMDNLLEQHIASMVSQDNEIQADIAHQKRYNPESDIESKVQGMISQANTSFGGISETMKTGYMTNPSYKSGTSKKPDTPMGIILNNREYSPHQLSEQGYEAVSSRFKELDNKKLDLNREEYKEYKQLEIFKNKIDETLKDDPIYKDFKAAEELGGLEGKKGTGASRIIGKISTGERYSYDKLDNGNYQMSKTFTTGSGADQTNTVGEEITPAQYKLIESYESNRDYVDEKTKAVTLQFTGYQLVPSTPKQNTSLDLLNETMENVFKANPVNINTMVNIESVFADNEMLNSLTPQHQDVISQAIYNSPPKSMKLVSVIPEGFSQKPEYVLRITPDKNFKNDLDGTGMFGDINIGEGKPIDLRVSFNEVDNGIVNTVNGYLEDYIAASGEGIINPMTGEVSNIGKQMQMDMQNNRQLSLLNGTKFSEMRSVRNPNIKLDVTNPDYNDISPFVLQKLAVEFRKKGMFLKTKPTDDEINNALKDYFKENNRFYAK